MRGIILAFIAIMQLALPGQAISRDMQQFRETGDYSVRAVVEKLEEAKEARVEINYGITRKIEGVWGFKWGFSSAQEEDEMPSLGIVGGLASVNKIGLVSQMMEITVEYEMGVEKIQTDEEDEVEIVKVGGVEVSAMAGIFKKIGIGGDLALIPYSAITNNGIEVGFDVQIFRLVNVDVAAIAPYANLSKANLRWTLDLTLFSTDF